MTSKRFLLIFIGILVLILVHTSGGRELLLPEAEAGRQAKQIAKLKKKAAGLGIGKKSRVVVRFIDGTWLYGYISDIKGDFLELINWQQGSKISANISKVKHLSLFIPVGDKLVAFLRIPSTVLRF